MHKLVRENIQFKRGIKPKNAMGLGKNRNNPFMHIKSESFKKLILKKWPDNNKFEIKLLQKTAALMEVDEETVLVALEPSGSLLYNIEDTDYYVNSETEKESDMINKNEYKYYIMLATTGEAYVIEENHGPTYMLGTIY